MNNFDIRSNISKEMRVKFRNRNKELEKIQRSSHDSEELKIKKSQEIMDIFYSEMEELKKRPEYIKSQKVHVQVVKSNNALQGVLRSRIQEEKDYEDVIENLDRDIVQKKMEYETMINGGESSREVEELNGLRQELEKTRLLKDQSIGDPIMWNRFRELEELLMNDIYDMEKTMKDRYIQELDIKKSELDDLIEKKLDIQRAHWSNIRQLEQDLKEQTMENEKVKELYFGKKKTISRNILTKDVIQTKKNDELKDALSVGSVSDILNKYDIQCKDLGDNVILPPDDQETIIISSESQVEIRDRILSVNKFGLFMDTINSRGMNLGGIVVYSGKIEKDMVRKNTYYAIYLPEVDKTVFINTGYGEATFVCKGQISVRQMATYGKERLQSELGAKRIVFNENDIDGWKNSLRSVLFQDESQVDKLSIQDMIRNELMNQNGELTEKGKLWFKLGCDARKVFKLENLGLGYLAILKNFGIERESKSDLYKFDAFCELSVKIFGENHPNVVELRKKLKFNSLSSDEIQNIIKGELIDENGKLTEKGIKRFESNGKARKMFRFVDGMMGYQAVAGKFGVFRENDYDLLKDDAFYELSVKIFGEDNPHVLKLKEKFRMNGLSLEDVQNMIRSEFMDETGKLTDKGEERFQLNTESRRSYKLMNGILGYTGIARKFGIQTQDAYDLFRDEMFYELSVKIFGKNHPKVLELKENFMMNSVTLEEMQNMIRSEFMDEKGELTETGIERFVLNTHARQIFRLENIMLGYVAIARKFGIERDEKFDLYKDDAFYELSVKIFGEDNPHVKILRRQLLLKKNILTGDEVRKIFLENKSKIEQFFSCDLAYRKWINGLQGEDLKKYRGFPKSFSGLVSVLGGDKKCQEGMYVIALLESDVAGKRYFEGWKRRGK